MNGDEVVVPAATTNNAKAVAETAPDVVVNEDRVGDESPDRIRVLKGYRQRKARIEFGGDYEGLWVSVWINGPRKLIKRLASDDSDEVDRAMCQFVLAHNLTFDDGEPLPTPLTLEALEDIDFPLYARIAQLGLEAIQKAAELPKR